MKEFLKFTFASLIGVILAGAVFVILSILTFVGIAASSESETVVKDNSIFVLDLKGNLVERAKDNPFQEFLGNDFETYGLDDILSSIKKAKENDLIKGIYLQPSYLSTNYASLEEIRNALLDFKESGKFIVAYADQYTQSMYYLCSVADKVIANPQGTISWHGIAYQPIFFKDLLDKVGIEMQIFKVGTYKSAVEPFISTEMSPANREQVTAYVNSIWSRLLSDISTSRDIPVDSLNAYADRLMEMQQAETYLKCGLADTLLYKDGVISYLKQLSGREEDESLHTLHLTDMINVKKNMPKDKSGNIIAIYYASGGIDDPSSNEDGINSNKVTADLRKLREDESVKAVVLRVNSPGGSAYGSEQIWNEVVRLKEKKPIIVSMGDYAASGGYYISCAANTIVADPTTLTGSIGIFGMFPNMKGLLTDKLGIHADVVKTNKFADMGNTFRPLNDDEKGAIQNYVNNGYKLFVKRCAEGRGMTIEAIEKIAEGRVWTGAMAKDLGLVDELGGINKALSIAADSAKIEKYTLVDYPAKESVFSSLLNQTKDDYLDSKLNESLGEYYSSIKFLKSIKEADRIQARLPFEAIIK